MNGCELKLNEQSLDTAQDYLRSELTVAELRRSLINEASVVFEELFINAVHQNGNNDTPAFVQVTKRLGEVRVNLSYEGKRFQLDEYEAQEYSIDILNCYGEKIFTRYSRGNNLLSIRVQHSTRRALLKYLIIFLLAAVSYFCILCFAPEKARYLVDEFVFPFEALFKNALVVLSVPLAFCCLVSNITTLISSNDRLINVRKIVLAVFLNSFATIAVGMFLCVILFRIIGLKDLYSPFNRFSASGMMGMTFKSFFASLVPSSFGGIFTSNLPFAFIVSSFVTAKAICSLGEPFETVKKGFDAITELLCKILSIVMVLLPVAYFAATIEDLFYSSLSDHFRNYLCIFSLVILSLVIVFLFQCIRIRRNGGNVSDFLRRSLPAIKENLLIGSSINAVPYNIRFFSRTFSIPLRHLRSNLPMLAQVSQAGSCLCLAVISTSLVFASGHEVNFSVILTIALMSFFLGVGAPGQPGSVAAGMIVMCPFLGIELDEVICVIIIAEVWLDWLATFVNTSVDILSEYNYALREKKRQNRHEQRSIL